MYILGAGLAGLLAGVLNPTFEIHQSGKLSKHKAVLRFRSPDIGDAVGIPFKKVKVYKGIWYKGESVQLAPKHIALYARKVSDYISPRSIVNQQTEERWIAPDNFYDRLYEMCADRIQYHDDAFPENVGISPCISTLPMPVIAKLLNQHIDLPPRDAQPVYVTRLKFRNANLYATYYYPHPTVLPYRASFTGNILIIESMFEMNAMDVADVMNSFGLHGLNELDYSVEVENYKQPSGKIAPMDEQTRRSFILNLTLQYQIFSLGRFATWRNLLLDDVYKDILHIKAMMYKDNYEVLRRHHES